MSYLNHLILLKKNFSNSYSFDIKKSTSFYNGKVFLYLLIFETELLSEWLKLFRMRKLISKKRNSIPRRVKDADIEKLMET